MNASGLLASMLACLSLLLSSAAMAGEAKAAGKVRVYVGTYTGPKSEGIYLVELDLATGKLSEPLLVAMTRNPSFLAIHPSQRFLYAVGEFETLGGKSGGGVSAFAIDKPTGKLTLLNQQPSQGAGPCHITLDKEGKNALVANYGGGSVAALPIQADGKLAAPSAFIQHQGSSVNPQRQKEPHAHSINLDAGNHFAFAADLGLDKVLVYRFDGSRGTLTPNDPPAGMVAPGSGPRHFAFHPNGRFAYVINELLNTVVAFAYDADKGSLREVQSITTLPEDFKGRSYTAEVQVHPSGKFLYGSNRGHDSIVAYSIDQETGKLTYAGHQASDIKEPRNFAMDPTGAYLLVGNQKSDSIVVFRIDQATGKLEATGNKVGVPTPVCLKMIQVN